MNIFNTTQTVMPLRTDISTTKIRAFGLKVNLTEED